MERSFATRDSGRNAAGLTFGEWHLAAGWTVTDMARCHMRFFKMLWGAWYRGAEPEIYSGQRHSELWLSE